MHFCALSLQRTPVAYLAVWGLVQCYAFHCIFVHSSAVPFFLAAGRDNGHSSLCEQKAYPALDFCSHRSAILPRILYIHFRYPALEVCPYRSAILPSII